MNIQHALDVAITVNGTTRDSGDAPISASTSALDWLRDLGLTGAKEGCAEGECGACSILVAKPDDGGGTRWTAINACLVPAAALDGGEVVTSEGLATDGELHPVQHEMAVRGGSQCGYCTPGFICSMAAEYYRPDRSAGEADADHGPNGFDLHALSGNLCRCTGYRPIRDAAYALGQVPQTDLLGQHRSTAPPDPRPTRIEGDHAFYRPPTLTDALQRLAQVPQAVLLAGSTDWGVEANLRHRRAPLILAIDHLPELRALTVDANQIEIGAALTLSEIERGLDGAVPLLDELFPQFASRLIRNSATLGGNIGTGSPIGDSPPVLLALDAQVVLTSSTGERVVPLSEYFTGYRTTVRTPGEIIRAIRIPTPLLPQSSFLKVAKRRFDDISSVAVAISADLTGGVVRNIRIGLGGVAATPLRAFETEDALRGQPWVAETARNAATALAAAGTPMDDHRASARYRAAMLEQSLLKFYDETVREMNR